MGCVGTCRHLTPIALRPLPVRLLLSISQYFSVYLSISQISGYQISGYQISGYQISDLRLSDLSYISVISQLYISDTLVPCQGACCKGQLQDTEESVTSKQLAAVTLGGSIRAAAVARPRTRTWCTPGDTLPF